MAHTIDPEPLLYVYHYNKYNSKETIQKTGTQTEDNEPEVLNREAEALIKPLFKFSGFFFTYNTIKCFNTAQP